MPPLWQRMPCRNVGDRKSASAIDNFLRYDFPRTFDDCPIDGVLRDDRGDRADVDFLHARNEYYGIRSSS
jgi:hypothetical protein